MSYHVPVLLKECIEGLAIRPDGIYVDVTFGGGGHSAEILKHLTTGHLYAFDQDADAKKNAEKFTESTFTFIEANFRYIKRYLKAHGVSKVNGILADLGISSHQINEASRGFSTRFDSLLDMRMDQSLKKSAMDVLNEYSEGELHKIFGMYGEVKNAKTLAGHVVSARINKKIETVEDFKKILKPLAPRNAENKYFAQVFQAIRIDVNEELKVIQEFLPQASELLDTEGRLVVISYHSLEDRLVKTFINKGVLTGEAEKDFYGNVLKPLSPLNKKPIEASEEELKENARARSGKLRIGVKL